MVGDELVWLEKWGGAKEAGGGKALMEVTLCLNNRVQTTPIATHSPRRSAVRVSI